MLVSEVVFVLYPILKCVELTEFVGTALSEVSVRLLPTHGNMLTSSCNYLELLILQVVASLVLPQNGTRLSVPYSWWGVSDKRLYVVWRRIYMNC